MNGSSPRALRQETRLIGPTSSPETLARWSDIAQRIQDAAALMRAQRELPMGAHDQTAWSNAHLQAFEKFVDGQKQLLASLRITAERDEAMLQSLEPHE